MVEGTGFENRQGSNPLVSSNLTSSAGMKYGRLAQLVERIVDVDEVTGSSPVSPTNTIINPLQRHALQGEYCGSRKGLDSLLPCPTFVGSITRGDPQRDRVRTFVFKLGCWFMSNSVDDRGHEDAQSTVL